MLRPQTLTRSLWRMAMNLYRSPYLRLLFWVLAIGVMLYLALRDVRLFEVWQTLRQAEFSFIGMAILSVALNVWGKTARWQVLIGPAGGGVGFGRLALALVSGQTLNLFLPGRVGELSRAYVIGGLGPGRIYVLGTIAVEKVLDMISYTLLFFLLVLLLPLPDWISDSGYTFSVVAGLVTLGLVILASSPSWFGRSLERVIVWLPERVRVQTLSRFQAGLESLSVIRRQSDLLKLALLSALVWGTAIWTNYLTFQALNLRLPWTAAGVLLIVLQAGISIPSVPGRIGLFQYLCILSLGLFGVSQVAGLSYGILLQAIVFVPTTLLSVPALWLFGWGGVQKNPSGSPEKLLE